MTDQITRAAEILEGYAEFIKAEQADNLERHPYIPDIDEAARILRAAVAVDVQGLMALARILAGTAYASAVDDINGAGADATKEAAAETALESALRLALAAREGWQPIETAPKDGRQLILLLTPSGFPQVAYSNTWWTAGFSVECKPTHWMPLPAAAPQAKEQTA